MLKMRRLSQEDDNLTALIVDNSNFSADTVKQGLAQLGVHKVKNATNYLSAIQMIKREKFNVIFCEYELKDGLFGIELLKEVKEIPDYYPAFIVTTSNNAKGIMVEILQNTPEDILLKPFNAIDFNNKIYKILTSYVKTKEVRMALAQKDYEKALGLFNSQKIKELTLKNKALFSWVTRSKIEIMLYQKQYKNIEDYTDFLINSGNCDLEWVRAFNIQSLLFQKSYDEVIKRANKCIEKYPLSIKSYLYLGSAHHQINELDISRKIYNRALDLSKRSIEAKRAISKVIHESGDSEEAFFSYKGLIELVSKSKEKKPEDYSNYANIAKEYAEMDIDVNPGNAILKALDIIKEGQSNFPDELSFDLHEKIYDAQSLLNRGQNEEALKKIESAMKVFSKILNKNSVALINTIITLQQLGEEIRANSLKDSLHSHDGSTKKNLEKRLKSYKNKEVEIFKKVKETLSEADRCIENNEYSIAVSKVREAVSYSPDSTALYFKLLDIELNFLETGAFAKIHIENCIHDFKECKAKLSTLSDQKKFKKSVKRFKDFVACHGGSFNNNKIIAQPKPSNKRELPRERRNTQMKIK